MYCIRKVLTTCFGHLQRDAIVQEYKNTIVDNRVTTTP